MHAFGTTASIALCWAGILAMPARADAQADQRQLQVLTNVSIPAVTTLGTVSPLAVTNRGKANGGINIVYVGGTVGTGSNASYCLDVRLTAAYPVSQDVMARRFDGSYVSMSVGSAAVTVAKHAGAGSFSDATSYRIASSRQISASDAASLQNYLTYSLVPLCP
jgi:hypothetical protein